MLPDDSWCYPSSWKTALLCAMLFSAKFCIVDAGDPIEVHLKKSKVPSCAHG